MNSGQPHPGVRNYHPDQLPAQEQIGLIDAWLSLSGS